MICLKCGKPMVLSEHAYFDVNVIAAKCLQCRVAKNVGGEKLFDLSQGEGYLEMHQEALEIDRKRKVIT